MNRNSIGPETAVVPKLLQPWPVISVSKSVTVKIALRDFRPYCATHVFDDDDPPTRRLLNLNGLLGSFDVSSFRKATHADMIAFAWLTKLRQMRERLWALLPVQTGEKLAQ